MGSNHTSEAEAALGKDGYDQSGTKHSSDNKNGVAAIPAFGHGLDKHMTTITTEETPLLPNSPSNGSSPGGDDERNANARWSIDTDFEGLPWWKKPSIFWLLPSYGVSAIAAGGLIVPRLNLVVSLICREYFAEKSIVEPGLTLTPVLLSGDDPRCQIPEIQALSSTFMLYTSLVAGILAAIASPKIGDLSDRYGRLPLLALTASGSLVSEVITILVAKYPDSVHYAWLLVGAVVEGICGSFIVGWAMSLSYATDCTPPAKRAVAFGYFQGSLFIGIAIGPIVAAYIVEATGSLLSVFYFAFIVHILFLLGIVFVVPESLSRRRQLAAREKFRMEPRDDRHILARIKSANILEPLKILYPTGQGSSPQLRMNLLSLSAVSTILFGSGMASMTVILLYAKYQFAWKNKEANLFLSFANICRVSALVLILPLLNYIFRTRYKKSTRQESGVEVERNSGSDNLDLWTIRAALLFEILGYGGFAAVRTPSLFVMSATFASIGGIGSPIIQSALTKHVPHEHTGQLLGATGLLHSLARVVFPAGINLIYASTVKTCPQTIFMILAGCFVVALLCSLFIRPRVYLEEPESPPSADSGLVMENEESTAI